MNKEEILAAAQKEKYKAKEYEDIVMSRGETLSGLVCFIVGVVLFITEYIYSHTLNLTLATIGFLACGVEFTHEGKHLHKRFYFVFGVLFIILGIITFIICMARLVRV